MDVLSHVMLYQDDRETTFSQDMLLPVLCKSDVLIVKHVSLQRSAAFRVLPGPTLTFWLCCLSPECPKSCKNTSSSILCGCVNMTDVKHDG
jgi:hypothetical protein